MVRSGSVTQFPRLAVSDLAGPGSSCWATPPLRPDGLERVLVRGGFQVTEADSVPAGRPPVRSPTWC